MSCAKRWMTGVLVVSAASTCHAGVVFNSSVREVTASSDGPGQSFSSTTFGLFSQTAGSTGPTYNATASQSSTIDAAALSVGFGGSARTNVDFINPQASAFSRLSLSFTVDAPTPYSGTSSFMPGFPSPQNLPQAALRDGVTNALVRSLLVPGSSPFTFDGTLPAGSYRLELEVPYPNPSGTTAGGTQSMTFDISFVPSPGTLAAIGVALLGSPARRRRSESR